MRSVDGDSMPTLSPPSEQHIQCDFVDTGHLVEELGLSSSHARAPEGDGFADLSDLSDLPESKDDLAPGGVQPELDLQPA